MYVVNPKCLEFIPTNQKYYMTDYEDNLMKQESIKSIRLEELAE